MGQTGTHHNACPVLPLYWHASMASASPRRQSATASHIGSPVRPLKTSGTSADPFKALSSAESPRLGPSAGLQTVGTLANHAAQPSRAKADHRRDNGCRA